MEVLFGTGGRRVAPGAAVRLRLCRAACRSPTCALIDGRLQLDVGPHLASQAGRVGQSLAGVRTILVTHAHADHLDPQFIWHRVWAGTDPVVLAGPSPVMAVCHEWLAPEQTDIELVEVSAGSELRLDGYRVVALPANHHAFGPVVLYAIEGPDGSRILYATDTGRWVDAAADLLSGWRFDVVLMEETFGDRTDLGEEHLGFDSFAEEVARLRTLVPTTRPAWWRCTSVTTTRRRRRSGPAWARSASSCSPRAPGSSCSGQALSASRATEHRRVLTRTQNPALRPQIRIRVRTPRGSVGQVGTPTRVGRAYGRGRRTPPGHPRRDPPSVRCRPAPGTPTASASPPRTPRPRARRSGATRWERPRRTPPARPGATRRRRPSRSP